MGVKRTLESFISKCVSIYGNKYDYSQSIYDGAHTKMIIICRQHGPFTQTPNSHYKGEGCPGCKKQFMVKSIEQFILDAQKVHGNKYGYSKSIYIDKMTKLVIICPIHGEFEQQPKTHIHGRSGCPKCSDRRLTRDIFIQRSVNVHGTRYDYVETEYIDIRTPVNIICSLHGVFSQLPSIHIKGSGCPSCVYKSESTIVDFIKEVLSDHEIIHNKSWEPMRQKRPDIRIPSLKLIIEYDGKQHFHTMNYFKNSSSKQEAVDVEKMYLAYKEGYTTIRIPYTCDVRTKEEWKEELRQHLFLHEDPDIIIIGDNYELYDRHIQDLEEAITGNINFDCFCPSSQYISSEMQDILSIFPQFVY